MRQPGGRRALTIVQTGLLIDTIGFGIIIPVMPDLIVDLTDAPLSEAARMSGWLQGGIASLVSVSAIIGPLVMTHALAFFTRAGAPVHFPGAAFALAGALTIGSMLIVGLGARAVFGRRGT